MRCSQTSAHCEGHYAHVTLRTGTSRPSAPSCTLQLKRGQELHGTGSRRRLSLIQANQVEGGAAAKAKCTAPPRGQDQRCGGPDCSAQSLENVRGAWLSRTARMHASERTGVWSTGQAVCPLRPSQRRSQSLACKGRFPAHLPGLHYSAVCHQALRTRFLAHFLLHPHPACVLLAMPGPARCDVAGLLICRQG